jgi:DNA-directed RNA polymerase specialized sigma subunit
MAAQPGRSHGAFLFNYIYPVHDIENKIYVKELLSRIPDNEATIIYLLYIEGRRGRELAGQFKVTEATISHIKRRGLNALKSVRHDNSCLNRYR